jgi:carboxypeptidase PM20D1
VNCRILPGDTGEKILSLIRNRLKDLPVEVEPIQDGILSDPSPDPPIQSEIFLRLKKIAGGVGGENLVTPFLLLGATDSRHFSPLTPQIYRFTPVLLSREDLPRIHGVNERISIKGFASAVAFYREVIREFGGR